MNRDQFFADIQAEVDRAYGKHGQELWNRHEFFGILLEEVDELWDTIKQNQSSQRLYEELVQVAAMCLRFAETGNRSVGGNNL